MSYVVSDFVKDRTKRTLRINDDVWDAVQEIAASRGFINHSGRKVGRGNVGAMLEALAHGSLGVHVSDDAARQAISEGKDWREVCR